MARVFSYEDLMAWIEKKTNEIQLCKYGRNRESLCQGIDEQRRYLAEIGEIETKVTHMLTRTYDNGKKQRLQESYDLLKTIIEKKVHCLETMLLVASLEENCSRISSEFDLRSVSIVNEEKLRKTDYSEMKRATSTDSISSTNSIAFNNIAGFISTTAQDCINGFRNNWDWIAKLVKCVGIHLKNSAAYQQFFHEVQESEPWMLEDFNRFSKALGSHSSKTSQDDVATIAADLDTIYVSLRQWEAKTNRLLKAASDLVPVPLRTDGITEPTPAISLCDYETKNISFADGEDLLLLNNSNPHTWKVRNGKGEEAEVPSVIVLIPGPSKEAIDIATKLQLQLLTTWTNALKRIGVRLLCHMLSVFKPVYNTREIAALSSMEDIDKERLLQVLTHIEEVLRNNWSDHEGFVSLQERLLALRMALEEIGEDDQKDADLYKSLIIEISALGQIMNIYQDMFKDWEKLKVVLETSRTPELMLIVDKWEQLQFVSREYFSKFWKSKLPLDERERSIMKTRNFTIDGVSFEDTIALLSPRPHSTRASLESIDSLHRPTVNIVRKLNMGDIVDCGNEVFTDERSVFEAMIDSGAGKTKDGVKTTTIQKSLELSTAKDLGRMQAFNYEFNTSSNMTKVKKNEPMQANEVTHKWSKVGDPEEKTTITMTRSNGTLNYGTVAEEGTLRMEEVIDGRGKYEHGETRSRSVITDRVTYGRATVEGDRKESSARTIRRLEPSQSSIGEEVESGFEELKEIDFGNHNRLSSSEYEGTRFGIASETKTAETEQLSSAEMEENKTFVIRSVVNPNDQTDISLQQAIMLGVIRPNDGIYVNSTSGAALPIATAMTDGLIKVMFSTTKRTPEKFSSVGIITVKTIRRMARPCMIVSVRDTLTKENLSLEEAQKRELLDEQQGFYINRLTGKKMMISEAVDNGLIVVEFCGEQQEPEVISKTYAVRAVVDHRLKKTITFHEAVRRGVIDKESGTYRDTQTNEKMYVGDAIMRGFLKARLIDDAHGLNIDPENKMVVDKTQKIRDRLLKPLKVISAFKMAAKDGIRR